MLQLRPEARPESEKAGSQMAYTMKGGSYTPETQFVENNYTFLDDVIYICCMLLSYIM